MWAERRGQFLSARPSSLPERQKPWEGVVEGQKIIFRPLYDADMLKKLQARLDRMKKGAPASPNADDDDSTKEERRERDEAVDDVNLESWLRGETEHEPFLIYAACQKRFARKHQSLRSVVEDLVLDEQLVPAGQIAPRLMKLITS